MLQKDKTNLSSLSYLSLYHILIWILKSGFFLHFFFLQKSAILCCFQLKKKCNANNFWHDPNWKLNSIFMFCLFFFFDWLNLKHLFHKNHYWGKELSLSFFSGCWTYSSSEIAFFNLICLEKVSKGVFIVRTLTYI